MEIKLESIEWPIALEALYGHWINCNDIWALTHVDHANISNLPPEMESCANMYGKFFRLTIAYGLLYVVIEGYRELKFSDNVIDDLLNENKYVENFKLLRNAVFHYQKNPTPSKLMKFIESKGSVEWAFKLKCAFENFFIKKLPINTFINEIKK